jgi:hypothetical protein
MYPSHDLELLRQQKLARIQLSAIARGEIVSGCSSIARRIELIEKFAHVVKRFSPLLGLSSLFLSKKLKVQRSLSAVSTAIKWVPAIFRVFKLFHGARAKAQASADTSS